VIDGKLPDPTNGATHYYATKMPKAPAWAAKAKKTLILGHHVFFKECHKHRDEQPLSRKSR
jgi:spore germination cell wall hydrolase CwlJ-like protein